MLAHCDLTVYLTVRYSVWAHCDHGISSYLLWVSPCEIRFELSCSIAGDIEFMIEKLIRYSLDHRIECGWNWLIAVLVNCCWFHNFGNEHQINHWSIVGKSHVKASRKWPSIREVLTVLVSDGNKMSIQSFMMNVGAGSSTLYFDGVSLRLICFIIFIILSLLLLF